MVTPHDDLFHFVFQHARHVVPWLRCVLPAAVVPAVDWASLQAAPERLHGLPLRLSIADLVFRAARVDAACADAPPVWLVVEHKAYEGADAERQLLRYAVHLGDQGRSRRLHAAVVGVLLHHGERPFAPRRAAPDDAFAPFEPRQPLVVDDLAVATEGELRARPLSALGTLMLLALRFLRGWTGEQALQAFERWAELLRAVDRDEGPPLGRDAVAKIACYALAVVEIAPHGLHETFERLLQRPEETIMSTLERTYQKGRAEGRAEGRVETILRLLEKRFGPLPSGTAERLRAGGDAELERWADRTLDARTIADVFAQ